MKTWWVERHQRGVKPAQPPRQIEHCILVISSSCLHDRIIFQPGKLIWLDPYMDTGYQIATNLDIEKTPKNHKPTYFVLIYFEIIIYVFIYTYISRAYLLNI